MFLIFVAGSLKTAPVTLTAAHKISICRGFCVSEGPRGTLSKVSKAVHGDGDGAH